MSTQKPKLRVGDLVYLSSGGPKMSIASVKGSRVSCDWFEGSAAKQKVFDQKQLMPAETEKKHEIELARAVAFILYEGVKMTGQDPLKMSLKQQCEALGKIPSPR